MPAKEPAAKQEQPVAATAKVEEKPIPSQEPKSQAPARSDAEKQVRSMLSKVAPEHAIMWLWESANGPQREKMIETIHELANQAKIQIDGMLFDTDDKPTIKPLLAKMQPIEIAEQAYEIAPKYVRKKIAQRIRRWRRSMRAHRSTEKSSRRFGWRTHLEGASTRRTPSRHGRRRWRSSNAMSAARRWMGGLFGTSRKRLRQFAEGQRRVLQGAGPWLRAGSWADSPEAWRDSGKKYYGRDKMDSSAAINHIGVNAENDWGRDTEWE